MHKQTVPLFAGILALFLSFATISEAATMNNLDARQAGIVPIAAFTAKGDIENLKTALNSGLEAGLTVNEIKEVLVQLYAYCGFPRSLNAINTFITVLDERAAKGVADTVGREASPIPTDKSRREYGTEIQTGLVGSPVSGRIFEFAPAIDTFLKEHLFADIFQRDVLNHQERELATIAALASIPGAEGQLGSHLTISMNVGLTEGQMRDFVTLLGTRVGMPESDTAAQQLEAVLESRAKASGK